MPERGDASGAAKKAKYCCAKTCLLCGLCASMQTRQPELLLPENNLRQKMECQVKQAASNVTRMFAAAQTAEAARIAEASIDYRLSGTTRPRWCRPLR